MIKKLIPNKIKRKIRIQQRKIRDNKSGEKLRFAKSTGQIENSKEVLQISQPIFYNPLSANKVDNIKLSTGLIEKLIIKPGEIFSFWEIIGEPTAEKGYKTGRNILGDSLQEDIGGGLCQVSGILYHLALKAGLTIKERHCHTIDLYTEENRYTPLGSDATVVFGYKDLRFENNTSAIIEFSFEVNQEQFTATLHADNEMDLHEIRFEREEFDSYRTIKTYRSSGKSEEEYINLSRYLKPDNDKT